MGQVYGALILETSKEQQINVAETLLQLIEVADNTELEETSKQILDVLNKIDGNTDGLETSLSSILTSLENIQGNTDELETGLTNILAAINELPSKYNNPVSLKVIDLSKDVAVAATGTDNTVVAPEEGKVWKVKNLTFEAPIITGATANTHSVHLIYGDIVEDRLASLSVVTEFSKAVDVRQRMDMSASVVSPPVTDVINPIEDIIITPESPLNIKYNNDTDGSQTRLNIFLTVEERNNI